MAYYKTFWRVLDREGNVLPMFFVTKKSAQEWLFSQPNINDLELEKVSM